MHPGAFMHLEYPNLTSIVYETPLIHGTGLRSKSHRSDNLQKDRWTIHLLGVFNDRAFGSGLRQHRLSSAYDLMPPALAAMELSVKDGNIRDICATCGSRGTSCPSTKRQQFMTCQLN